MVELILVSVLHLACILTDNKTQSVLAAWPRSYTRQQTSDSDTVQNVCQFTSTEAKRRH